MSVASFDPLNFLARHGLADARALTVESLPGGYQNQVHRVRGGGIDWVVKRFSPAAEITLFPNLADAEAMALRRLSECGAAPRPIAFVEDAEDAPVLVYEFYAGQPWSGRVAPVAGLLRKIAHVDADGFRSVPMVPADILAQGDIFVAECQPGSRQRLAAVRPRPVEIAPGPRRLLHTDFGPGNLIEGADGLKAIDWQCPAAGDPAEDLAAFLSPAFQILYGRAPLTPKEEESLLQAYGDEQTIDRLRLLRPFFDWRMAAYCAMRQQKLAESRPEASERYRLSTRALLERLGKGA
ncbi:MAG TPA: phosphotransferase [Dongiaceae bacterium]|nr:phosphotransferase [Dongiaceae bacterium]